MSTKLIAENILEASNFLSATEQEGEHWGQPEPASDNIGHMRLLNSGTPAAFTYAGTATGNGAAGGTTVIDSVLSAFGNDYFIGATVTMTGGTCSGESKAVTDFAQATGTLTMAAFTAQIDTGDTFTLTVAYATRDFHVALTHSGDIGLGAQFQWSHDGGVTFFGRDSLDRATWDGKIKIDAMAESAQAGHPSIIVKKDGTWVCYYVAKHVDPINNHWEYRTSTNKGLSWSAAAEVTVGGLYTLPPEQGSLLVLKNGRWLLSCGYYSILAWSEIIYSDDEGATWNVLLYTANRIGPLLELEDGRLVVVSNDTTPGVLLRLSNDGGANWSTPSTVAATNAKNPVVVQADNGDVICVYETDVDSAGHWEIKAKISSDYGLNWGSAISIMNYDGSHEFKNPTIAKDLNGDLYIAAVNVTPNPAEITMEHSTDDGATWSGSHHVLATSSDDPGILGLCLVDGHLMICLWSDVADDLYHVRAGYWETYSLPNGPFCATTIMPQNLICGAYLIWNGGAGITADDWSFTPEYDYSMTNLIEDSPSRPWRSEQDNVTMSIVIDMGANAVHYADAVAFFGCNVRTLTFQMNTTNSWGAPTISQAVSFDKFSATVISIVGNCIVSAISTYKDHELTGMYLRMTSGTDSGLTWKIIDNMGTLVFIETTAATNIAVNDTYAIYQNSVWQGIGDTPPYVFRYMRISIPAQQTAENYYQIGSMMVGRVTTLTNGFSRGYGKDYEYGVTLLDTPAGGLIPINNFNRKRRFKLEFTSSKDGRKEMLALLDYISGKNIVLILDSTVLTDCHLVKLRGSVKQTNVKPDYFSFKAEFEEVL